MPFPFHHRLAAAAGLALVAQIALAQVTAATRSYDLPAQSLSSTVARIAGDSGARVSVEADLARGVTAAPVRGNLTAEAALQQALAGTGLELVRTGSGALTVRRAAAAPDASASPTGRESALPLVTVTGLAERNGVTEATGSYAEKITTVGGKIPLALREVPQTVTVITRQQIEDKALNTVTQALDEVPGLALMNGHMNSSRFLSRGFEITNVRVDGAAAMSSTTLGQDVDMAFYDHIEVLRGADGLFGGASEPGGAINLVRKKPTASPQVLVQTQVGSWQHRRADLDVSGPLNAAGSLRGRAVIAQQNNHFFYDASGRKRSMLYGVLEADLQPQTLLTLGASYDHLHSPTQGYGLARLSSGGDAWLPRSIHMSGVDDALTKISKTAFARLEHGLNADWKLSLDTRHIQTDQDLFAHYFSADAGITAGTGAGVGDRGLGSQRVGNRDTAVDLSLRGAFDLAGRRHEAVLGFDWHRNREHGDLGEPLGGTAAITVPNIYQFDPSMYRRPATVLVSIYDQTETQSGVYGALRMRLADPLRFIVGGRLSRYSYDYQLERLNEWSYDSVYKDRNVFTPYAAATYDLGAWTAYGSVAETYKSQASSLGGPLPGKPLEPVTGRNYELGLKGDHAGGRLHSAFAMYQIERKGAAVSDPAYPYTSGAGGSACCYTGDGHIVSRGFDAELTGEVARGVQLMAGYTYNDNRDRNAVSAARYQALSPRHQLKAFASWRLPRTIGPWKIGGGARVQSVTAVSGTAYPLDANGVPSASPISYSFSQGGYTVWNAFAEYELSPSWTATLNLSNLLDKRYYRTIGQLGYGSYYGEPRSAMLTLRGRF